MTAVLQVHGLRAGYGSIRVLHGIDFEVKKGEIVALLGANGAGKTTTLRALSGIIPARGAIWLDGQDVIAMSADKRAQRGIAHIPQGRGTFVDFTVAENLALAPILFATKPPSVPHSITGTTSSPGWPLDDISLRAAYPAASSRCSQSRAP